MGPPALIGIRAAQLDTTPTDYLRRARLDHAHRDLITGGPAHESVTAVAYRWVSQRQPVRYHYRHAYGVVPSHALRE